MSVTDRSVGESVRHARERRGMSQVALADALGEVGVSGIYGPTIAKIEAGTRPLRFAEAVGLMRVLQVPLDYFSGREDVSPHQLEVQEYMARVRRSFRAVEDSVDDLTGDRERLLELLGWAPLEKGGEPWYVEVVHVLDAYTLPLAVARGMPGGTGDTPAALRALSSEFAEAANAYERDGA